jgi:hypothetical protein
MKHILTMTIAALALAAPVVGQRVMVEPVAVPGSPPSEAQTVAVRQAVERMAVESRITPGAPYSADSVTESVQVLSDGNRIARKTLARVYRDSDGRTRREQLSATGEVRSVSISDPVSGSTYVLNPADRTAQRNHGFVALPTAVAPAAGARGRGSVTASRTTDTGVVVAVPNDSDEAARKREVETSVAVAAAGGGGGRGGGRGSGTGSGGSAGTLVYPADAVSLPRTVAPGGFAGGGTVNKEDLGTQVVEGVAATGTRTTTTIAAGAIGNEQPIQIVSEQWFSPELKVLVMTKHNDPRTGETTYRLTNILQTEPARALFEVPPDYTLKESLIRHQSPMQQ